MPRRFPNIRFILAHGGGFVPYAAHRLAVTIFGETGRDPAAILDWTRFRGHPAGGAVLVRPDRFVAWRTQDSTSVTERLAHVPRTLLGFAAVTKP